MIAHDISAVIDNIVERNGRICEFWSVSHGWASPEAADLLSRSRLDLQVSMSETLHYWTDKAGPGDLVLGWANIGALMEGTLKWFLAVFYDDYRNDLDAKRDKHGNLVNPDGLKLELLRQFFQKKIDHIYDAHKAFIERAQFRRNAIHTFKHREIGTHDELQQGIIDYRALLEDADGIIPYPTREDWN